MKYQGLIAGSIAILIAVVLFTVLATYVSDVSTDENLRDVEYDSYNQTVLSKSNVVNTRSEEHTSELQSLS